MSKQEDDAQEKSLEATPHRIQKAREQGDVAQSRELNTAASYIGVLVALALFADWSVELFGVYGSAFFDRPEELAGVLMGPGSQGALATIFWAYFAAAAPILFIPAVCVILSLIAQQAIVLSLSKVEPKMSRISLISNAKQKYGLTGMVEFLKSATKLLVLSIVLGMIAIAQAPEYVMLAQLDGRVLGARLGDETMIYIGAATLVAIVVGGADFFWQRFDHAKKLRMSYQEMKDENKQTEGDPAMKQRRREKAQALASNKMLQKVPEADVIIVNPTHYAVALKWSRKRGEAPVCVAKGVDEIAARIREIAFENQVPIHRDPPTARALHAVVELDQEIPEEHYRAVALAIRFSDEVRAKARREGKA
ncbi:MAG: flagellar biosynthesis protein FlhB [Neomegalonema sp.]